MITQGSPIKYGDQILRLLEAIHQPTEVSVSHSEGHQKGSMEVTRGNQAADQAAKRAALQNNDLIGVATLIAQTNLPETPSYTEGRTLKAKSEGFLPFHSCLETLDHWTKPQERLLEDPLTNPEEIWYTDESSFFLDGKRRAGYASLQF